MPPQAPFDFRRAGLHPAIDGGVVHRNAALFQHFLEVTVADAIPAIPPNGPKNDPAPEMPPLEIACHRFTPFGLKKQGCGENAQGALTKDLMARCGLSKATICRYIGTKDD